MSASPVITIEAQSPIGNAINKSLLKISQHYIVQHWTFMALSSPLKDKTGKKVEVGS